MGKAAERAGNRKVMVRNGSGKNHHLMLQVGRSFDDEQVDNLDGLSVSPYIAYYW